MKRDVALIGVDAKGLKWYSFRYLWDGDDAAPRMGVMADEAPAHALRYANGFAFVGYHLL
ncbi:MAG: hypothetical protein ACT4OF_00020 [Caulobacteraceae bacterium]